MILPIFTLLINQYLQLKATITTTVTIIIVVTIAIN